MDYVVKNIHTAIRLTDWSDLDRSLLELRIVETEEAKLLIGYHLLTGTLFILDERLPDDEA